MSLTVRYKARFGMAAREADRRAGSPPVAKEGEGLAQSPTPPKATRLARQLALTYLIERRIEAGSIRGYAQASRLLVISRARISQIGKLRWLEPRVQEEILVGNFNATERSVR